MAAYVDLSLPRRDPVHGKARRQVWAFPGTEGSLPLHPTRAQRGFGSGIRPDPRLHSGGSGRRGEQGVAAGFLLQLTLGLLQKPCTVPRDPSVSRGPQQRVGDGGKAGVPPSFPIRGFCPSSWSTGGQRGGGGSAGVSRSPGWAECVGCRGQAAEKHRRGWEPTEGSARR